MQAISGAAWESLAAGWLHIVFALTALAGHTLARWTLGRVLRARDDSFWQKALRPLGRSTRAAALLLAMQLAQATTPLAAALQPLVQTLITLGWIAALAWIALDLGGLLGSLMQRSYDISSEDNLKARTVLTKVRLFRRLYAFFVCLLALAATLMVFDATRNIGASVLASAGIAGAVAALSAQKLLGSVISGVQIAVTQPIRLDDVVVVEGEWGRIEEIGMTCVVVRIWDERRLILPTSYFLERPIQNWTRSSSDIMGAALLSVDHKAPVPVIRAELTRICREEAGELWDGKVCVLQVIEAGQAALTLRALVSSSNSSRNWDLRCLVRERLVDFLRQSLPEALPKTRLTFEHPGQAGTELDHDPARR